MQYASRQQAERAAKKTQRLADALIEHLAENLPYSQSGSLRQDAEQAIDQAQARLDAR